MGKKKNDEIVIINKFKDESTVDVKRTLEQVFKMYYELQVSKNRI